MDLDIINRFSNLFRSNERSFGTYDVNKKKAVTHHRRITAEDFKTHLEGGIGVGCVPIMDTHECWWAAIDIDTEEGEQKPDHLRIEKDLREKDIPLTICRSRSGDAHLYLFLSEPVPATTVIKALKSWAGVLGFRGVEIFPKQGKLAVDKKTGEQPYGNWINLPYHASEDTKRYAIEGGKIVTLEHFIEVAEARRVDARTLIEKSSYDHSEAPPCIQAMMANGVSSGVRNEALYNFAIYAKQAFPQDWEDRSFDFNARHMEKPLEHGEAKTVISSVRRRDYRYKCKTEPCRSFCKASECIKRKFGITEKEKGILELGTHPKFSQLRKYSTNPVRWELTVDDQDVMMTTAQLYDHRQVRMAIGETLLKIIPPMKNDEWMLLLKPLMDQAMVIEAPSESSKDGEVADKLIEFLSKADSSDPANTVLREKLLLSQPVVQHLPETTIPAYFFRASDFKSFLKSQKCEELKGPDLYFALKNKVGMSHTKLKVKKIPVHVWFVLKENVDIFNEDIDPLKFESEF